MSLFRPQPGFCCVCGARDAYDFESQNGTQRAVCCSQSCRVEFDRRCVLYALGKEFYASAPSGTPGGEANG